MPLWSSSNINSSSLLLFCRIQELGLCRFLSINLPISGFLSVFLEGSNSPRYPWGLLWVWPNLFLHCPLFIPSLSLSAGQHISFIISCPAASFSFTAFGISSSIPVKFSHKKRFSFLESGTRDNIFSASLQKMEPWYLHRRSKLGNRLGRVRKCFLGSGTQDSEQCQQTKEGVCTCPR